MGLLQIVDRSYRIAFGDVIDVKFNVLGSLPDCDRLPRHRPVGPEAAPKAAVSGR